MSDWVLKTRSSGLFDAPCKLVPLNIFYFAIFISGNLSFFKNENIYIEKKLIASFTSFTLIYKHHSQNTTLKVTKSIFNVQRIAH